MEDLLYKTISRAKTALLEERGSKFYATVSPTETRDDFKRFLALAKDKNPGATHYCWAFRIGFSPTDELSSDDGEPSGSAGLPILRVLAGKEMVNVACVVARFYGGTKLGVGGLIRAYSQAASSALMQAKIVEVQERVKFFVELPYKILNDFEAMLRREDGKVIESTFGEQVEITFDLPKSREENVLSTLADISAGQLKPKLKE
ncbi:MAG TPA: YigZ family protein [candidate division Zixibacteria bacterium]|nr:YigZ family protein [candidate division Zixibacteria bacterium]